LRAGDAAPDIAWRLFPFQSGSNEKARPIRRASELFQHASDGGLINPQFS
jgi:hypothetical protein